jgi:uncharacterized membrane protein YbaN (DUF454 family)
MQSLRRPFFVAIGTLSLAAGVAGIFIPLLPTTPFLLLASACYLRGSRRMHAWLLSHRHLGPYISAFEEGRGLPVRVKVIAIATLWASMAYAIWIVPLDAVKVGLFVLACGVSAWIASMPTLRQAAD